MRKKLLSILICLCLVLTLLPTVAIPAAAANISGTITLDSDWNDDDVISSDVTITGSADAANPVVITVNGTVTVNACITVSSGYVTFTGGTLQRGSSNTGKLLDVSDDGTVNLGAITIDGNNVEATSEAILVEGSSNTATLNIGSEAVIKNCNRNGNGAAIYIADNGTLNMTGGSITDNTAGVDGVVHMVSGTFNMTGGSITGNTAGTNGGGVYVYGGIFNVGGKAVVSSNKAGATGSETASNVYLPKVSGVQKTLTISSALTTGASIGVTTETAPNATTSVTITGSNDADYSGYFHSDNASYSIVNDAANPDAQVVKLALPSTTPAATTTTVAKTAATQASVDFTLTNTPAYADSQTWKVYSGSTGDTQASGVTVSNVGNTLTLAHASDIPAETYYVAVTETGKAESARLTLAVSAYVAPSSSGSSSPTYSITNGTTSTANGSVTLDKTNATSGSTVKITPKAKDGYEVDTITVKDANGKTIDVTKNADGTFSFKMPSGKVTVEATFKKIVTEAPWVNPFGDVSESDWFYDAVEYANENGLFAGTGADTFSPSAPMTREMLWTVLGRLDGQTMTGSDVFDAAKDWATEKGITDGSNPNGEITREQLVTILWRYAGSPAPTGNLDGFSDADSVADYAKLAMAWAVENGIVSGSIGALMPTNPATRGQVAAIVMRYAQSAEK